MNYLHSYACPPALEYFQRLDVNDIRDNSMRDVGEDDTDYSATVDALARYDRGEIVYFAIDEDGIYFAQ